VAAFETHLETIGILRLRDEPILSWIQISEAIGTRFIDGDNLVVRVQFELVAEPAFRAASGGQTTTTVALSGFISASAGSFYRFSAPVWTSAPSGPRS
jgi:hypothetical protein